MFLSLSFISAPRQGNRQTALIFNCFFGKTIKKFRQYYLLLCHDLHNSKVGRKNSDHNKLKIDLKIIIHSVWKWPEKNLGQFARACCYLLFNSNLKFKIFLRQNTRHIINLITRSQKSWENSKKIYWDSCERFKKKLTCFSKAIETLFVQPSFVEALVVVLK